MIIKLKLQAPSRSLTCVGDLQPPRQVFSGILQQVSSQSRGASSQHSDSQTCPEAQQQEVREPSAFFSGLVFTATGISLRSFRGPRMSAVQKCSYSC